MNHVLIRFAAALALAGAVLASPAFAFDPDAPRSIVVRTGDLNLASQVGRATLGRRIDHAARIVCGAPDPRDLVAMQGTAACRAVARAAALPQIQLALVDRPERMAAASSRSR